MARNGCWRLWFRLRFLRRSILRGGRPRHPSHSSDLFWARCIRACAPRAWILLRRCPMSDASIIQIEKLRKVYRVGKVDVEALRGVDLTVGRGEFLSIVGPSGSGKSTLFHVVGGLTPATSGRVLVDNQDLAQMSDAGRTRLRKSAVAFVFQKYNLLPTLSAGDNIA